MPRVRDLGLLSSMLVWRLVLPLLRRVVPFERLVRITARPTSSNPEPARVASIVRIGGRLWRDSAAPCLERSVCIHRQLGRAGARSVLILGLASDHRGHAWVELDGTALLERSPPHLRFRELMRFDSEGALLTSSDVSPRGDA